MIKHKQKTFIFVLMPFTEAFKDIYKFGIKGAAEELGAYAERVDEQIFQEGILDRIFNQIGKADVMVADMTGKNPNVFYEVGYAHALGKMVILLTQNANDIPFDLKHRQHIVYGGSIENLKIQLVEKLAWAINQVKIETESSGQLNDGNAILDLEFKSYRIYPAPIGVTGPTIYINHEIQHDDDFYIFRGELTNRSPNASPPVTIAYLYTNPNSLISPIVNKIDKRILESHNPELITIDQAPDGLIARYAINIQIPSLLPRNTYSFKINLYGGGGNSYEDDFPIRFEVVAADKITFYPFILHYKQTLNYRYERLLEDKRRSDELFK